MFGYHLDENRRGTHLIRVDTSLDGTSDFGALGFRVGKIVGEGVPVFDGFKTRPTLDELDALGAALATSGGVALFIVPGITPPYATVEHAFGGRPVPEAQIATRPDVDETYRYFCTAADSQFDIVHVGCPHASFEEMKDYARMLTGKRIGTNIEFWITTSRAVRNMAAEAGVLKTLEASGAKVISDTCPISCHFARTTSPDPCGCRRRRSARWSSIPPSRRNMSRHDPLRHAADRHAGSDRNRDHRQICVRAAPTCRPGMTDIARAARSPAWHKAPPWSAPRRSPFLGDIDIRTGQIVGDLPSVRSWCAARC